jgi:hypothetical protein
MDITTASTRLQLQSQDNDHAPATKGSSCLAVKEHFTSRHPSLCQSMWLQGRAVNSSLLENPCTNLWFFLTLQHQHYPPYYRIPSIHKMSLGDKESKMLAPSFGHANSVVQHGGSEAGEEEHVCSDASGQDINKQHEPGKQAHAFGLEADQERPPPALITCLRTLWTPQQHDQEACKALENH